MRARRILLVDDNKETLDVQEAVLRNIGGYEVARAASVAVALELFAARRPDLVLLDLAMPNVDGWQFLQSKRTEGTTIPVLVVSGLAKVEVPSGLRTRLSGYIVKPFEVPQLLSACAQALHAPGIVRGGRVRAGSRRTLVMNAAIRSTGLHLRGQLLDFSAGGFRVHCDVPLPLDEVIDVRVNLPWARSDVAFRGRVRWRSVHVHGAESIGPAPGETAVFGDAEGCA
jgi:CheY-like chemotaxis protein